MGAIHPSLLVALLLVAGLGALAVPEARPTDPQVLPAGAHPSAATPASKPSYLTPEVSAPATPAVPARFELNAGQDAPEVLARGFAPHAELELRRDGLRVTTPEGNVRLDVPGADWTGVRGTGAGASFTNYLRGPQDDWVMGVQHHTRLDVPGILPGLDLVIYPADGSFEFDVVVAPGHDVSAFRLLVADGSWRLGPDGDALAQAGTATVRLLAPVSYQDAEAGRLPVASRFLIEGGALTFAVGPYDRSLPLVVDPKISYASFLSGEAGAYYTLGDEGRAITAAPAEGRGIVYVAGQTTSQRFTDKGDTYDTTPATQNGNDLTEAFLAKFDTTRSGDDSLLWVTYLGGNGHDTITDLAADGARVYAVGGTTSDAVAEVGTSNLNSFLGPYYCVLNVYYQIMGFGFQYPCTVPSAPTPGPPSFPTTPSAYQSGNRGAGDDAFLAVLSRDGKTLEYATLLGGALWDMAYGVDLAPDGNPVVVGQTAYNGAGFPTTSGVVQPRHGDVVDGVPDAFVAKLDISKSGPASLLWSTFFGAQGPTMAFDVAVQADGDVAIVGAHLQRCTNEPSGYVGTFSTILGRQASICPSLATTSGALLRTGVDEDIDAFVAVVSGDGTQLDYATLLAGTPTLYPYQTMEAAFGVTTFGEELYVTGGTSSNRFPTTPTAYQPADPYDGDQNIFVTRLDPRADGSAQLVASTYWGAPITTGWSFGYSAGNSIRVDSDGTVVVGGIADSYWWYGNPSLPVVAAGPNVPIVNSGRDFALGRFSADLSQLQASLPWGTGEDDGGYLYLGNLGLGLSQYRLYDYATYSDPVAHSMDLADEAIYYFGTAGFGMLPTPRGAVTTGVDRDPYLAVFTKQEPIVHCAPQPPVTRGVPITFTLGESLGIDAPIDPVTSEWWFEGPLGFEGPPDLSPGDPGHSATPSHVYGASDALLYEVQVRVRDTSDRLPNEGVGRCKVSLTNSPPVARLEVSPGPHVVNGTTRVTALGASPTYDLETPDPADLYYFWSLPGSEDCQEQPERPWELACRWHTRGTHPIGLLVIDRHGGAAEAKVDIEVTKPQPVAAFEADDVSYCAEAPAVTFRDLSRKSVTDLTRWAWDFNGDGHRDSAEREPVHTFAPGTHVVTLKVTDAEGHSSTTTESVTVTRLTGPLAAFASSLQGTLYLGAPVHFADTSKAGTAGPLATREWTFSDGTRPQGAAFHHTFAAPGDHVVELVVTDAMGCTAATKQTFRVLDLPAPDEAPSVAANMTPLLDWTPRAPYVGELVWFEDATPVGVWSLRERTWRIGGIESHDAEALHRFERAGAHQVELTRRTADGGVATLTVTVPVREPGDADPQEPSSAPTASAGTDQVVRPGARVVLDGAASRSGNGAALRYAWTQVEGPPVALAVPTSATPGFTAPQVEVPVTLVFHVVVHDGTARSAPDLVTVRVQPDDAGFAAVPGAGGRVAFTPQAEAPSALRWDFGDGATSREATPVHEYARSGTYTVRLTLGDGPAASTVEEAVEVDVRAGLARGPLADGPGSAPRGFAGMGIPYVLAAFVLAAGVFGLAAVALARRRD